MSTRKKEWCRKKCHQHCLIEQIRIISDEIKRWRYLTCFWMKTYDYTVETVSIAGSQGLFAEMCISSGARDRAKLEKRENPYALNSWIIFFPQTHAFLYFLTIPSSFLCFFLIFFFKIKKTLVRCHELLEFATTQFLYVYFSVFLNSATLCAHTHKIHLKLDSSVATFSHQCKKTLFLKTFSLPFEISIHGFEMNYFNFFYLHFFVQIKKRVLKSPEYVSDLNGGKIRNAEKKEIINKLYERLVVSQEIVVNGNTSFIKINVKSCCELIYCAINFCIKLDWDYLKLLLSFMRILFVHFRDSFDRVKEIHRVMDL